MLVSMNDRVPTRSNNRYDDVFRMLSKSSHTQDFLEGVFGLGVRGLLLDLLDADRAFPYIYRRKVWWTTDRNARAALVRRKKL